MNQRQIIITFSAAILFIATLAIAMGCRKNRNHVPVVTCKHSPLVLSDSTCNLSVPKLWHRTYREILVNFSDTSYALPDTTFELAVLSSTTVVASGDTFYYNADSSINGRLYYEPTPGVYGPMIYQYATDSIAFIHWLQINSATRKYVTYVHE